MDCFVLENVSFSYPASADKAIENLNLCIKDGDFCVLFGASGCGKSTLLRLLKTALSPHGALEGKITYHGKALTEADSKTQAQKIGFVSQSPDSQIVCDKVWHELAFGAESLGMEQNAIRSRVAEITAFFGIEEWFYRDVSELSGGQKQILVLASVMVTNPDVLILDEPTSQLDPIAASAFLGMLAKINRELGVTVIIAEHRLEDVMTYATSTAFMENGNIVCHGAPREVAIAMRHNAMLAALPASARLWTLLEGQGNCPITVKDGKVFLTQYATTHSFTEYTKKKPTFGETVLSSRDVWFRYEKAGRDVLKNLSFSLRRGELYAIVGGNGAGKSTLLGVLAGLKKAQRGNIVKNGKIGMLPQNPQGLFVGKTLSEDLQSVCGENGDSRLHTVCEMCDIAHLLARHPFDLSGGEMQRAALAKILLAEPDIVLLDEPTKGMDAVFKRQLAEILYKLLENGRAVLIVSHDLEFCAEYADTVGLFFDGGITVSGTPEEVFSQNRFYTTFVSRMVAEFLPHTVTADGVLRSFGKEAEKIPPKKQSPAVGHTEGRAALQTPTEKRKLSGRTSFACLLILLIIPLTLYIGVFRFGSQSGGIVSVAVLIECMLPFFMVFEDRKPRAKEIVTLSVLCGLGIAGRAAFFMLPQFKPVLAIAIIAGIAFGGEAGFTVGAVIMLVSNMLFSQGAWTPFQMFSTGVIGFLAGVLFRKGFLPRKKWVITLFGALSAVVVYGGIMNPASVLIWTPASFGWKAVFASYLTGFPADLVHAAATSVFLFFLAEPMLEKLERIKAKYGFAS